MHQQHAAGEHHQAVEPDVGLGQRVLEQVGFALGLGGGRDHEEPEEGAESQHQDRGVEPEAQPLHAHRRRADHRQDRREDQRIEREEEQVAERRKRIDAVQPVRRVQPIAHGV